MEKMYRFSKKFIIPSFLFILILLLSFNPITSSGKGDMGLFSVSKKQIDLLIKRNSPSSYIVNDMDIFLIDSNETIELRFEKSQDSLSLNKAKKDLIKLQKLVEISAEQEEELIKVFFDRHEYLKVPHTSTERTQLVFNALYKRLEQSLDAKQVQILAEAGLIKLWFKTEE